MDLIEVFQLRNIRQQQEQTNELLEKIRRLQLTPAQRDAEDRQREVEKKAEAERANRDTFLALAIGFPIAGIASLAFLLSHYWQSFS
jgi:chemotaxis response regulator CheB